MNRSYLIDANDACIRRPFFYCVLTWKLHDRTLLALLFYLIILIFPLEMTWLVFLLQLKEIVNQGKLVSDEIIISLLSKRLKKGEEKGESGFILDGFPRTVNQAVRNFFMYHESFLLLFISSGRKNLVIKFHLFQLIVFLST